MASESLLNNYYNRGGYNQPSRIGFMMKMIRNLKPLTQEEWEIWYLENVHDEEYLDGLAQEMFLINTMFLFLSVKTTSMMSCLEEHSVDTTGKIKL